jgi:molecular chaperone HtpG
VLHLREDAAEYVEPSRLREIVKTYSDHVALPIVLDHKGKEETLNAASALWMRAKSEIKSEQYKEFYHHVGHAGDEPWLTLHWRAEGLIEYTGLLFVPSAKPFDLFDPLRKHRLKLYVRRVFITDDCQELLPPWLRFVRGVIDSEDLPLNVSREMLQSNPMLARIRGQIVKRMLAELQKKAKEAPEEYATFWENFGAVLKEGLYEDRDERDQLLPLARFRSTASEGLVSLEDYTARMKPGQEAIYTIAGDNLELLKKSPQLEGFRARGVEVLLLTDPVDEFWAPAIGKYKDWAFKSATRGGADLAKIGGAEAEKKNGAEAAKSDPNAASLVAMFKLALGEAVKDVRLSERLTDSPVCLVADEGDLDIHLERMLRQHRQLDSLSKRILEVNPRHPLVARLASQIGKDGASAVISEVAWVLLDQARIIEGESLPDPAAFSRRLSALLEKGLG